MGAFDCPRSSLHGRRKQVRGRGARNWEEKWGTGEKAGEHLRPLADTKFLLVDLGYKPHGNYRTVILFDEDVLSKALEGLNLVAIILKPEREATVRALLKKKDF